MARYGSSEQSDGDLYAMLSSPRGGGIEQPNIPSQQSSNQRYSNNKMSTAGYGKPGAVDMPRARGSVKDTEANKLLAHDFNSQELSDFSEEDDDGDLRRRRDSESFSRMRNAPDINKHRTVNTYAKDVDIIGEGI
jgi:hypothetical protein